MPGCMCLAGCVARGVLREKQITKKGSGCSSEIYMFQSIHLLIGSDQMKVSERMTDEPVSVDTTATAREVAGIMKEKNIGTVLVTENGHLKGIATDRQIATRVIAGGKDPEKTRVSESMTKDPVTASPDMMICDATKIIGGNGFRRIPVVKNEKVVGILSAADVAMHARTCNVCRENLFDEAEKAVSGV